MQRLRSLIITAAVIVVILITHYFGWLRPVENLMVRVLSPVETRLSGVRLGWQHWTGTWFSRRDLTADVASLQQQLEQAHVDQSELSRLRSENELLRTELGFAQSQPNKYVASEIMTGISDPLSQTLVINRGTADGVATGLAVVTEKGVLIGKVVEANSNYSKVLLLTDVTSRIAATIQNQARTAGLVEGQYGLSIAMTNIPQDQEIKPGDLVVTSGLEGQIPRNLPIAKIESVTQIESQIFKTAVLSPVASFANLSHVLVLVP
ncbi:MAG: rod shape-determining protein MreC [Candidatus Buchananbacteria bacterium]|nr:rod shape-determining protein MreC [Candidatus Buchananbacteria bacterium]